MEDRAEVTKKRIACSLGLGNHNKFAKWSEWPPKTRHRPEVQTTNIGVHAEWQLEKGICAGKMGKRMGME